MGWRATSRFCSPSCSSTNIALRQTNPFRSENYGEEIRKKSLATRIENGFAHLNGGNGTGPTTQQTAVAQAMGWETEFVVATGNPARGVRHIPGIPVNYKIDVACQELMIAVEIDGQGHLSKLVKERDARKDAWLKRNGWTVLRFSNREVDRNLDSVLREIRLASSTSKQELGTTLLTDS